MASIIKRKKNYSVVYNYVDENGETINICVLHLSDHNDYSPSALLSPKQPFRFMSNSYSIYTAFNFFFA